MFEKKIILIVALLFAGLFQVNDVMGQSENRFIRKGNKAFEESDYQKAEVEYRRALEKNDNSFKGEFNLGSVLYQQENFDEAAKAFSRISEQANEAENKAGAFYNLGNSLMNKQEYEAAIEAYKNALRQNPDDFNSKYNLEFAMHQLKEQQKQEQQQQQNQDQQNEDQQEDNKEDQENQNNQQQNENKEDDQQQQQQDNQQQSDSQSGEQDQPQEQNAQQISKEDAERLLQALREREKNTLDKIKREKLKNAKSVKSEKDW
jgi:Ca-activated chloride channel homolog